MALAVLLSCTALLYLPDLSASGYGNAFYAAAAEAGSRSWSAAFFGSLDAQNFITVDKPPASLWVTGLVVRVFGMNSWSVLVPQALMGVAAVAVLVAAVRRTVPDPRRGAVAGLLAGAVLASTPAAALMFRFNDPDALLVLLSTVAAYCLARAVHSASWRWLVVVAVAVGTAFLTKMLEAFLVLPGFGLAYLLMAPTSWRRRGLHLLGALAALVASAGWWPLAVQLIPASDRPYVGGSTDDTVWNLALRYNGFDRLVGRDTVAPSVRATLPVTGPGRLFTAEMGNEISWLLPVALVALSYLVYLLARARLERDERAAVVSWGGWLLVVATVLSVMHGTVHPYYTVTLAPAVAALVGLGAVRSWHDRREWQGRLAAAAMLALGAWWSSILLHRNAFGPSWLPATVMIVGAAAAVAVLVGRRLLIPGLAAGAAAAAVGTIAFSVATAVTPHRGTVPVALGTAHTAPDAGTVDPALAALLADTTTTWSAATNGSQSAAALEIASGTAVMAVGGWAGDPAPTLAEFVDAVHAGRIAYYVEAGRGGAAAPHGEVIRAANHSLAHSREIADWVAGEYRPVTIGTALVYRLIR